MGRGGGSASSSSSSSLGSSNYPALSINPSLSQLDRDLTTDLGLGLGISTSHQHLTARSEQLSNRPPVEPLLRNNAPAEEETECNSATFFVKVYMEGIPIGRKLDLLAHGGYHDLIRTLDLMFNTSIIWSEMDVEDYQQCHVLTYEDKEGDWLMVGDVPWEMFLSCVRRLKITRVDKY